ncbi:MAG: type II toxin-antitoxin system HicA family toxin [Azoarcus sp.]|jgi:predicted RNA binding protein YcfA (HicA-like mRNA interferase family)|nr:type II toxin-antitoxin system HicA family toxin [Azoarcus sp.]
MCIGVYNRAIDSATIIARLRRDGWRKANQVGSHVKFKHPSRLGMVTVPHPKKDLPVGALRSIFR